MSDARQDCPLLTRQACPSPSLPKGKAIAQPGGSAFPAHARFLPRRASAHAVCSVHQKRLLLKFHLLQPYLPLKIQFQYRSIREVFLVHVPQPSPSVGSLFYPIAMSVCTMITFCLEVING